MKRILGLSLFWLGVGMAVWVLIPRSIFTIFFAILFIVVGYNLFCSC